MGLLSALGFGSKNLDNDVSGVTNPSNWLVGALGGGPTSSGKRIGLNAAMACSAVYACTKILSEDVAKLEWNLWKKSEDGTRQKAKRHFLNRLLYRPNRFQNRFEFLEQVMFNLVLRGNSVIVILRDRNGTPTELIPVSSDRITLLEATDGTLFYQITRTGYHQMALLGTQPLAVPEEDVLHIRLMAPDGVVGLSVISQGREAIAQSLVMEEYASRLFANSARPGGILRVKTRLTPEVAARMKASWDAAHGGVGRVGGTAVLEEDTDWKSLGMSSVDAQFMEGRRFQLEEIARMFRMPLHKINSMENSTKNNMQTQSLEYLTDTLQPYLERIETAFEWKFELDPDYCLEFDVEKLLRVDIKTRYDAYAVAKQSGLLSTNEIRIKEGYNPVPGGDEVMTPLNMVPLGTDLVALQQANKKPENPNTPRTNVDADKS